MVDLGDGHGAREHEGLGSASSAVALGGAASSAIQIKWSDFQTHDRIGLLGFSGSM
jgi:hypothetical protein